MWFGVKIASKNVANRSRNPLKMLQNWCPRRSWMHLWSIRATIGHSIRKWSRGISHFWGAFGSPLGPWGSQKLPQCLLVGPFWEPFWTKSRKRGIQKGIPKLIPKRRRKNMPKGFQNYAKMETQIRDCSCFLEEGERWKTVGFSNRKRGSDHVERFRYWLRIYAKSMQKWDMEKEHRTDAKMAPKWKPKSHQKWKMEWKRHATK